MFGYTGSCQGRRSIRTFKNRDVPEETIEKLVEAGTWSPSAGNIQPWEFIIVRKPEIKKKLVEAAWGQSFIAEASVVIVVCANTNRSSEGYGDRGVTLYCLQDTAAAIQNVLLVAYSVGLGACWIGAFDEENAREALKIPNGIRPVAILPIGHPAETPQPRKRRPLDQIVHYEAF